MRLRAEYQVGAELRFLSNLDLMHMFERALRRADLPYALSEGFNPHIRLSMGTVLPVGLWGKQEYFDLDLREEISTPEFMNRLNRALPPGVEVGRAVPISAQELSLMNIINAAAYKLLLRQADLPAQAFFESFLARPTIRVKGRGKKKNLDKDIRSGIYRIDVEEEEPVYQVTIWVAVGEPLNVRYDELLDALMDHGMDKKSLIDIYRDGNYIYQDSAFYTPLEKVE